MIKIIECIKTKFLLLPKITTSKKPGEFINAFEMADLYEHLPLDNMK